MVRVSKTKQKVPARRLSERVARCVGGFLVAILLSQPVRANGSETACAAERARAKARLTAVASAQTPDGGVVFSGPDVVLDHHPLIATLALELFSGERDLSLLEITHDAVVRQTGFLFAQSDRDGDFMLERASSPNYVPGDQIEDVGFNALFALDLSSLSRVCMELDRPVDAMYWYQGSRTIGERLVGQSYDHRSRYFLPVSNTSQRRESFYLALSAMPVFFDRTLGANLSRPMLTQYVLKNQQPNPETAYRFLDWSTADEELSDGVSATYALRAVLLLSLLYQNGFEGDAERFADGITTWLEQRAETGTLHEPETDPTWVDYFTCLITQGGYKQLFPNHIELDLFARTGAMTGVLEEDARAELQENISRLKSFLAESIDASAPDIDAAERAMREVYWTISSMRTRWRTRSLFTPRDRGQIPGFDIYMAFDELIDDVVSTLHDVETRISEAKANDSGFDVSVTVMNDVVVPGDPVSIRISLHTVREPVDVTSLVIYHEQEGDTLVGGAATIHVMPGDTSHDLYHQYVVTGDLGSLNAIRLSTDTQLSDGSRLRHHFALGAFLTNPITYAVSFPQGRILRGSTVPVNVEVTKHVDKSYVVNTEWYSPAGLTPREGRSLELFLTDDVKSGTFSMNVSVPTPCRPGEFPFLVKVFGNGNDWGTIQSSFYKHYQWLFLGPFSMKDEPLDAAYPPEKQVNLRESYPGVIRPISWGTLPSRAYLDDGELDLTSLIPRQSVGYLHTVIETSMERRATISLTAGQRSVVFVNGQEVLRVDGDAIGKPQQKVVHLTAGMNGILIKMLSGGTSRVFFQMGSQNDDLTSDEFNNNLWELVDGFQEFYERGQDQYREAETQRIVTLSYEDSKANSVSVVGSFNGWSPVNSNMRRDKDGGWEISLHLPPGRYAYRFLVNNSTQVIDPNSEQQEPDGYGGMNSVLYVR